MNTETLIRVTVCINRKKGLSEEEFHKYWANFHGSLVSDWLLRSGVVRYVQYHTTSQHKALAKTMSDSTGRPLLEYDGLADFHVRKYDDFENAFLDPEYQEKIRPDELKFVDMDSIRATVGVDFVPINDGKVAKDHQSSF